VKLLKNWDNKNWLSSRSYINSFNSFLLKKKKLNKSSQILDIGCGRGKIFGSISRKLKLISKPIGIDSVFHKDVDKSLDFRNEDIFSFFNKNKTKFDLIMIKQTLHLFSDNKKIKLLKICKKNLKKKGVLIILSLNTLNNQIPCFELMRRRLEKGLSRDIKMFKLIYKILKNIKVNKFRFKVSISKRKYTQMLKKRYISCLLNLTKKQINNGVKEIKSLYPNKIIFDDVLICISFKY